MSCVAPVLDGCASYAELKLLLPLSFVIVAVLTRHKWMPVCRQIAQHMPVDTVQQ